MDFFSRFLLPCRTAGWFALGDECINAPEGLIVLLWCSSGIADATSTNCGFCNPALDQGLLDAVGSMFTQYLVAGVVALSVSVTDKLYVGTL